MASLKKQSKNKDEQQKQYLKEMYHMQQRIIGVKLNEERIPNQCNNPAIHLRHRKKTKRKEAEQVLSRCQWLESPMNAEHVDSLDSPLRTCERTTLSKSASKIDIGQFATFSISFTQSGSCISPCRSQKAITARFPSGNNTTVPSRPQSAKSRLQEHSVISSTVFCTTLELQNRPLTACTNYKRHNTVSTLKLNSLAKNQHIKRWPKNKSLCNNGKLKQKLDIQSVHNNHVVAYIPQIYLDIEDNTINENY